MKRVEYWVQSRHVRDDPDWFDRFREETETHAVQAAQQRAATAYDHAYRAVRRDIDESVVNEFPPLRKV